MSTQYYVAVIVYQSTSASPNYTPLYEECITVVKADTAAEAKSKVEDLAKHRSTQYQNAAGQEIAWSLYQIIDISPMLADSFDAVTEIYARHFRDIEAYGQFETLLK